MAKSKALIVVDSTFIRLAFIMAESEMLLQLSRRPFDSLHHGRIGDATTTEYKTLRLGFVMAE